MGVRLNPCFGCPLSEGCELRAEWRKRVSGLGLRSATFDCPHLTKAIRPGRRVEIMAPFAVWTDGHYDGPQMDIVKRPVAATITIAASGHYFVCTIDPRDDMETKFRFRRKMRHSRIRRFLDEPDERLCPALSHVVRDGKCDAPHENGGRALCQPPDFDPF